MPTKKYILILFSIGLFLNSCVTKKDIVYFQNAKRSEAMAVDTESFAPTFKIDDNISIFVSTLDMEAVRPFNLVSAGGQDSAQPVNFLIDVEGNIDYPVLGKIKLLGLTVEEAKDLLKEKLSEYLKDPIVNIRILNFRVTVAGEVRNPGVFPITGERVSILEAITLAGDLTIKGRRDNILIVRTHKNGKSYSRIDLTDKALFKSPLYYLNQNDYIYVEPNKSAVTGASGDQRLTTVLSISTFLVGIALLINRF